MMSTILIKDLAVVEAISDEEAASIHGGLIRRPNWKQVAEMRKITGAYEDLYPGLGKQADNETPLVQMLPL